jgi:hypothetical protein
MSSDGSFSLVIVFPVVSSMLAALCAVVLARDAIARPRPDKVIWAGAFAMFALAAGADAAGIALGWSSWLARTYYATGPALVVAYLAIGQLYLLAPITMRRIGPGVVLLVTALWVSLVVNAPIDTPRLADEGWEAIDRGPELVGTAILINTLGTVIIVGGTGWSVWRYGRRGQHRNRMTGCALICAGTLAVAAGGSLTRLGHYEYLYIAMSVGIALIFLGVLVARKPDVAAASVDVASPRSSTGKVPASAIEFIQDLLLTRSDAEIDAICTEWSVPRDDAPALSRADARRAWRLRSLLPTTVVTAFDGQPVSTRRQVTTLYHDVLVWERAGRDEITEIVASAEGATPVRKAHQGAVDGAG